MSVLLQTKFSLSFIAETIGVSVSTVSRERRRNSNAKGVYDARTAVLKVIRRKARTPGNHRIAPYVRSRVFELFRRRRTLGVFQGYMSRALSKNKTTGQERKTDFASPKT
ncbi:MAG: hypothetical protein SPF62_05480 [Prevotella sp.]|nr:hypothetical protein [Prevotella sp.]